MPVSAEGAGRPPLDRSLLARTAVLPPEIAVEILEQTPSTNAVLAERARAGAPEGTVVVAEYQSAGRGRLGRVWQTPPRAVLTLSLLLRPTVPPERWPWLPLLTGHVLAKTLRGAGFSAGVKWPNDVLIGDRKVSGILVERVETPTGPAAVIGVGLNTHLTAEELPVETATSLALEPAETPERTRLMVDLLSALFEAYQVWQLGGDAGARRLADSFAAACLTLDREIRGDLPDGSVLRGRAVGVDPGGRLVVRAASGEVAVGAGDIRHVRSTDG